MPLFFTLITILGFSSLCIFLMHKLHFSEAVGLIIAGLFLSSPPFESIVINGHEEVITILAHLGLFSLMFVSGFEISGNMLAKEKEESLILTLFTVSTSLILGTIVFYFLGYSIETSIVMGICFGITAEATKARVLLQLNEMKTRIASLLMGTGIINDVIGVIALILVTYFFTDKLSFKELGILGAVLMSFVLGMFFHLYFNRFSDRVKKIEKFLLYTIVPFFFINMGIHFSIKELEFSFYIFIAVLLTSFMGQMLGSLLSKTLIKLTWAQTFLIGFSMNSKGAVELVIAFIALEMGVLTSELYSALILTSLISVILFQGVAFRISAEENNIMN